MRLKPNHIYLLVIALLVSFSISLAQESVSPVLEGMETEKPNSGNDYNYTDGGEGNTQRGQTLSPPANTPPPVSSSTSRDNTQGTKSTQANPAKAKTAQQKQGGEAQQKPEDSVLGFNFLYYIFQKYKMSDIID